MTDELQRELLENLYIHRPLPLHRERSLEASFPKKTVLDTRVLYSDEFRTAEPKAGGTGRLREEKGILTLSAPLWARKWPEGASGDGDYSNYGTARLELRFDKKDWRGYNRLRFHVRPRIEGGRIAHLNAAVENAGQIPLPDKFGREGATVFDLTCGEWNECIWEFAGMPRDAIRCLMLYVFCSGGDVGEREELSYDFRDVILERVEKPEH